MNIIYHIKSGAIRSLKAWKGILIVCLMTLILVSTLALPFRAGINSALGKSMITELLADGVSFDVVTDLLSNSGTIFSSLSAGFLYVIFLSILMNAFLAGGLFSIIRNTGVRPDAVQFFKESASNFWSFLVIMAICSLMIIILFFAVVVVPIMVVGGADSPAEGIGFKTGRNFAIVFAIILPVFLLVTDYARVWQVSHDKMKPFKAIGFGFSQSFRTFVSSYPLMIVLLIVQVLFGVFVLNKILVINPVTGGGVFLLFLSSQLLFIIKIILRVWRYSCVTSLMEQYQTDKIMIIK